MARRKLLAPDIGRFSQLCTDYRLDPHTAAFDDRGAEPPTAGALDREYSTRGTSTDSDTRDSGSGHAVQSTRPVT